VEKRFWFSKEDCPLLFGLNAGAEYGLAKRWPREISSRPQSSATTNPMPLVDIRKSGRTRTGRRHCREIQRDAPGPVVTAQSLAGLTSLRELCAALKRCDLVLTNDTGPMHLAAAVGTRWWRFLAARRPRLTAPGLPGETKHALLKHNVPCAPCFRATVRSIFAACTELVWKVWCSSKLITGG